MRSVSLLRIWKEGIQLALTRNNFIIHTAAVWQHCSSLRPFLNSRHGLNDHFYPFYRIVKSQSNRDLHCSSSQRLQIEIKLLHNFARFRRRVLHVTFSVDILLDSSSRNILELTVQNKMKDQQICNIISSLVILSPGYRRYCGSFYGNELKIILFWIHRFLILNEKS